MGDSSPYPPRGGCVRLLSEPRDRRYNFLPTNRRIVAGAPTTDGIIRKETTMSQMKTVDRNRIEFLVSLRWTLPKIAADLGRSPSTIRSELLGHRLDSDKGLTTQ